jgi:hypothetical protein
MGNASFGLDPKQRASRANFKEMSDESDLIQYMPETVVRLFLCL